MGQEKNRGGADVMQKCEVYSRVVGYLSPISQWNQGKKEEKKDRVDYEIPGEAKK